MSDKQRTEVCRACDPKHDRYCLVLDESASPGSYHWHRIPFIHGERLLWEFRTIAAETDNDRQSFREYVLGHSEEFRIGVFFTPVFHNCAGPDLRYEPSDQSNAD